MKANEKAAGKTANMSGARVRPVVGGAIRIDEGSEYDTQARGFLEKTGARVTARYLGEMPTDGGKCHAAYRVTITSASGKMAITFYDSLQNTWDGKQTISAYSVLACLTKYEVGGFDDFCSDMGLFPMDSVADYHKAMKTWKACKREFAGVCRVWPCAEDRDALAEIA